MVRQTAAIAVLAVAAFGLLAAGPAQAQGVVHTPAGYRPASCVYQVPAGSRVIDSQTVQYPNATTHSFAPCANPFENTITISSVPGIAVKNYPFQFGRPFVDGAIANQPQILIDGVPAATQADVKNLYPDGSVEFAVIAVVIPLIPSSGSVTLSFQDTVTNSNVPLTQSQMLAPGFNFDANVVLTPTGMSYGGGAFNARTMLQNGDYKLWTAGPVAQTIILGDDTTARRYDVGTGDGFHPLRPRYYATFWPRRTRSSSARS
jgi:hypothetical protein